VAGGDFAVVKQKDRLYYRDVYEHYVRLHDISESLRDLLVGRSKPTFRLWTIVWMTSWL